MIPVGFGYSGPMLAHTGCCAFTQLRASNETTREELSELMREHEQSVRVKWNPRKGLGGAPTLWCVTVMPHEGALAEVLRGLGWTERFQFPRRVGYPKGYNVLWTYTYPMLDRPK